MRFWKACLAFCTAVAADCGAECDATLLVQQMMKDVSKHIQLRNETTNVTKVATDDSEGFPVPAPAEAASCDNIIEAMGRGINIGNTYDMNQDNQDPAVVKERVKWIKDKGFGHVRLPVTWGQSFDPSSQLTSEVTEVVDYAISLGLYVVLNTHHENWLKEHYDGSKYFNDLFWNLWHNIAMHFDSRDGHLIFKILNEPEKAFGSWGGGQWPQPFDQVSIDRTRQINGVGFDAVRRVSPKRFVFLSPNAMASIGTASYVYPNPTNMPGGGNDACLGVEVHTYDPWDFAGDTGSNAYFGTVERMKLGLYDTWRDLHIWQFHSAVKLYVGEFGIGRRDCCKAERDHDIVREYYKFAMNHFRSNGWAAAAWDDPGWFAIYHDQSNGIHNQLLDTYK